MGRKRQRLGRLVVLSAPSGAGKTTLCKRLLRRRKNLAFSVSVTTRAPRPGEKDGREYYFISDAAFNAMRKRRELAEWARVHDHFYGTPRHLLEEKRARGKDVLLDIDVQGALQIKRCYPEALLIFVRTPRFQDLEKRLRRRSSEGDADIHRRLRDARKELRFIGRYDHVVVNDTLPRALKALNTILDDSHNMTTRRTNHD